MTSLHVSQNCLLVPAVIKARADQNFFIEISPPLKSVIVI